MNIGGVIKGSLLAGLVLNVLEALLNVFVAGTTWEEVAAGPGIVQGPLAMTYSVLGGFAMRTLAVWLYAAMRPRIGPGPSSALKVDLVLWLPAGAWPYRENEG